MFSSPSTSGAEDSVMGAWLGEGELGVVSLSPVGQWRGIPSPGDWGSGSDLKPCVMWSTAAFICGGPAHPRRWPGIDVLSAVTCSLTIAVMLLLFR